MNLKSMECLSSLLSEISQLYTSSLQLPQLLRGPLALPRKRSSGLSVSSLKPKRGTCPVSHLVLPGHTAHKLASNLLSLLDFFGIFKHLIPCNCIYVLDYFFPDALTGFYPAGISFSYFLAPIIKIIKSDYKISLSPLLLFVFLPWCFSNCPIQLRYHQLVAQCWGSTCAPLCRFSQHAYLGLHVLI